MIKVKKLMPAVDRKQKKWISVESMLYFLEEKKREFMKTTKYDCCEEVLNDIINELEENQEVHKR